MSSKILVHSRRLLLHSPLSQSGINRNTPAPDPSLLDPGTPGSASHFDANVVTILAVLLCALVCALGINSIVRCALRCSTRVGSEPEPGHAARLAMTGARRKAVRAIPVKLYSPGLKLNGSGTECAICLSDLVSGERVRVMPKCSHGFHVRCIDRWLMAQATCPTCRQCLFPTDQKDSDCGEAGQIDAGMDRSVIVPLGPEPFVQNDRLVG